MNQECPICFNEICSKDINGQICFICNHYYCAECCSQPYITEGKKCAVCRQSFKTEEDEELFALINITLTKNKDEYLHLGLVYCKIAKNYLDYNLDYAVSLYTYAQELGIEIPYLKIADKFFEKREYQNALLWYQTMPNNIKASIQIARIYDTLNKKELAIKWFKQAAQLGNHQSLSTIGCIHYKNKEYQKAKYWFELGTAFKEPHAINNLAVYYRNIEHNYKKFMDLLKPLQKTNAAAMYNLSVEHKRLGNYFTASRLLNKSADLNYSPAIKMLNEN